MPRRSEWNDALSRIVRESLGVDVHEASLLPAEELEEMMLSAWRDGVSPREFFREYLSENPRDSGDPLFEEF